MNVVVMVLVLAGCGSQTTVVDRSGTGAVIGHALAGPTCPVANENVPGCEAVPVAGTVQLTTGGHVEATAPLDAGGAYAANLPPGTYQLTVDVDGRTFPVCPPQRAVVTAGAETVVDYSCDTGIR